MQLLSDELHSWQQVASPTYLHPARTHTQCLVLTFCLRGWQVAGDVSRNWKGGSVLGGSVGGDSASTRRITPREPHSPVSARSRAQARTSSASPPPGRDGGGELQPIHESGEFSRSGQLSPATAVDHAHAHSSPRGPLGYPSPRRVKSVSPRRERPSEDLARDVKSMPAGMHRTMSSQVPSPCQRRMQCPALTACVWRCSRESTVAPLGWRPQRRAG